MSRLNMALIVASKINRRAALKGQFRNATNLSAVINAAGIFPERSFLSVAQQVRAANVVEVAHLAATQAGEVALAWFVQASPSL